MTHFDPFSAQLFIGNGYVGTEHNAQNVINPSTLRPCGRIANAASAEIDRALASAEAARSAWAGLDAKARAQFLHAVAQSIESTDKHDVSLIMTLEVGKPYPESVGELANVASVFRLIDNDALSFGGWKNSSIGRSLSRQGLDAFRQSKMAVHRRSSASS